jgi:hypothetical protein
MCSGQLDLGGRSSRAPIALVTLAARPTILRMRPRNGTRRASPGPRGPRDPREPQGARRATAAQDAASEPGPARSLARPASTAMTP